MSDSVYEKDGRRIRSSIDRMRSNDGRAVWDWSRSLVPVDLHARQAYSYGRHFPLFRYVPRNGRQPELFVINGDESPVRGRGWGGSRTPDHQSDTRAYVEKLGAASLVIPFSALEGARIDIDSIRPVHVRPDATWQETVTRPPADTPEYRKRETVHVERSSASLDDVPEQQRKTWRYANGTHEYRDIPRGADGLYRWSVPETREIPPDADGMYRWEETRHRLGDCLFSAVRIGETVRRRYLSSFDYEERAPLYFLVQVPRGAGDTVEAAVDSLAPRAVWAARARGLEVRRQGDIFFVETGLTDAALEQRGIRSRARLTQWDRDARARKGEVGFVAPLTAGQVRAMDRFRRAEFLRITRDARVQLEHRTAPKAGPRTEKGARRKWAKVRASDARDLELARARLRAVTFGKAGTFHGRAWRYAPVDRYTRLSPLQHERAQVAYAIRHARESLELVEARAARNAMGRAQARDAYRAPFTAGPAAIVAHGMAKAAASARFYPERYGAGDAERRARVRRALAVYGTAHTAREVVTVKGGAVYVRGKVSHRPGLDPGRPSWDTAPDHRPLNLDPSVWYLAIRNRVPRARA